ncbi:MAG: DUF1553 domain-containing protein [Bacteroidia bacterium]|nr:DUF1553 domain-containing protein [Bacteroidia bacterium]
MKTLLLIFFALAAALLAACGDNLPPEVITAEKLLPDKIDFNLHVRPILSDRCFACHGPDKNARKGKFRLDTEEGAFQAFDSLGKHFPIVPGDINRSWVIQRMIAKDPEYQMPPPESNLTVSPEEIATIAKWIRQGAKWKRHWAFIPPEKHPLPTVRQTSWPINDIDFFVLARLEKEGLSPSPPADKETLLRRVSLDLTGLPPTIPEIENFLADDSPDAYEKVVNRLLASPHYGEQMAVHWLDLSRYADTHGYQADYYRPHWPWRDWVIRALNANMPYDQFVTWQLAGDLLPNPSPEQIMATGFNRNHAQNAEGGIVQEEFRVEYVADRTQTFATAFLGLTMQCARCHDHKYDPLSQKEFYGLFSFFNNVAEAGQITWNVGDMPGPVLLLTDTEKQAQLDFIRRQIGQQEEKIAAYKKTRRKDFEEEGDPKKPMVIPATPKGLVAFFPLENASNAKIANTANPSLSGKIIDPITDKIAEEPPVIVTGKNGKGLKLNGDNALAFPGVGRFSRYQAFSVGLWVNVPAQLKEGVIFHGNKGADLYTFKGYQVSVENKRLDVRLAHDFPWNAIHFLSEEDIPREQWVHLMLTYDGSSKASGVNLYLNGRKMTMETVRDNLIKDMVFHPQQPGGGYIDTYLKVGARWRSRGLAEGLADEIAVFDRELTPLEVEVFSTTKTPESGNRPGPNPEDLLEYFLRTQDSTYSALLDSLTLLRQKEVMEVEALKELMVMDEMEKPRQTFLLERGAYDAPAEPVSPLTPAAVKVFEEKRKDRLGLAQWLFDPQNPLPARVTVNRYWQLFFGRGIVATTEDFGSQGKLPTHPELLDELAREFVATGWDVKALHKKIVMSATYRQTSKAAATLMEQDPDNELLARGPKSRLTAEMLRDQVLFASGLLVPKIGGPPVNPYQPAGLWDFNRMGGDYAQSHGEDLYRRSLYTFWKRTIPPPAMNTFDAPNRSYCVVRRQKTTTPLQALVLMNDPQFLEAARVLASTVLQTTPNPSEAISQVFRRLTSRKPSEKEQALLEEQFDKSLRKYRDNPPKTEGILHIGEFPADTLSDKFTLAAMTVVTTTIMNFDAAQMER